MNNFINIRVSAETKRKIEAKASQKGRTVSDYAREVLMHDANNLEVLDILEQQTRLLNSVLKFAISSSISLEEFIKLDKESTSQNMSTTLKRNVAVQMSKIFQQLTTERED